MKNETAEFEKKWQSFWEKKGIYEANAGNNKPRKYILDMFPYPSGAGLHVGHTEGYTGTDVLSRYYRMQGFEVMHPMGWDAFGLPAENYAIKHGIHPAISTAENVETFRRQIKAVGLSYDWPRELDTSNPNYYKWTQWLFIMLFRQGLAYKKQAPANWCPSCETVLANEQVVDGKCERCDSQVEQKDLSQWFWRITKYADRLISGLDGIDWPESTKRMQLNWIGRKEGVEIDYEVAGSEEKVTVFTTRPDTNFGATFVVLAPEHPMALGLTDEAHKLEVEAYIEEARKKTELERLSEGRKKTGAFTGRFAINQLTGRQMPIWVADFVLSTVGTGAVVGVPGHDKRDFEFAHEMKLPVLRVVLGPDGDAGEITTLQQVQEEAGVMVNSGFLDGKPITEAIAAIADHVVEKGWGRKVTTYHLRDWLVSRQRYWGAPIPMIFCEQCYQKNQGERDDMPGWYAIAEKDLPLELPTDVDFVPRGYSPLTTSPTYQEGVVCPVCSSPARREVDTMDTFVDSSWYFLRFCDPSNEQQAFEVDKVRQWCPVDVYVGGAEHTVLHLLYSRFLYKVLFDQGMVAPDKLDEPFLLMRHPGIILGEDSRKMSKRWGNVINPDDVVKKYGADTLRMYEMFMGPFDASKPWSTATVEGVFRYLGRVMRLFEATSQSISGTDNQTQSMSDKSPDWEKSLHAMVKRVGEDIPAFAFNTAIAGMMEFYNEASQWQQNKLAVNWNVIWDTWLRVMAPFAPHLTEELWHRMEDRAEESIHTQPWPEYDPAKLVAITIEMAVQVNGKVREVIELPADQIQNQEEVKKMVLASEKIQKYLEGREPKVIYVPGKVINLVV